jgi:ribonuclease R
MMDKIGEEFDGVISAVTGFGFFVELQSIYVEGLVHIASLVQDYFAFDASKHQLYGERTGVRYRLGDMVKIRVVRVNLDDKKIDFELIQSGKKIAKTKSSSGRKKAEASGKATKSDKDKKPSSKPKAKRRRRS